MNAAATAPRPSDAPGSRGRERELDEHTLVRAQRGDASAQRKLVVQYQHRVFAVLGRMLRGHPRELVEDLAQETFLRVFRALAGFDRAGAARLSTWILKIASNLAIDEMRRKRPVVSASIAPDQEHQPSHARSDETARAHRLADFVEQALAELSPEYRAAFVLREFEELDYAEIAVALDIDIGTVKSRLSRARKRLRDLLQESLEQEHRNA